MLLIFLSLFAMPILPTQYNAYDNDHFSKRKKGREKQNYRIRKGEGETRRAKIDKNRTMTLAPHPAGKTAPGSFRPKAYSKHIYIPSR